MQEDTANSICETKRLIKWISQNPLSWYSICGDGNGQARYFDQMNSIKELQKNEFYSQILNLVFNSQNGIDEIAITAIVEEILVTWDKEQWNEVINRMIAKLNEAHQQAKKQRAEATRAVEEQVTDEAR